MPPNRCVRDFLKDDKAKRDKLENDQRQEIADMGKKLQKELSRVNEVKTLLEDAEQALKLKEKEINEVKIDRADSYLDGFDFAIAQEVPATPGPSEVPIEGELKTAGENPDVIADVAQTGA
ncbi:hypothetical protein A2U01_0017369 [Trifolium medium]|uniref:Uncharacterized protein n=1 Tax=Trifolium medium TaxID=97028 RepID=A0A392N9T5_9FABA|nr:hypothetical protein [Trifolium medium]